MRVYTEHAIFIASSCRMYFGPQREFINMLTHGDTGVSLLRTVVGTSVSETVLSKDTPVVTVDVLVSELWRGDFCTSWHFTNKCTRGGGSRLGKTDLVQKFNWLKMSPREVKFHLPRQKQVRPVLTYLHPDVKKGIRQNCVLADENTLLRTIENSVAGV